MSWYWFLMLIQYRFYMKKDIPYILDTMHTMFQDYPVTELVYETPFQCLMSVMLSAQTTDKQVNKVTKDLYMIIKSPQDVLDMGEERLGQHIRTVGLWTSKKKNVYKTAALLVQKTHEVEEKRIEDFAWSWVSIKTYVDSSDVYTHWWYIIPDTIEDMVVLPWVGIKTAKVVLYVLYGQKWVAVDTHVHRVMNRLWVISTKNPNQSSKVLEERIPNSYKDIAHHSIIYFGRYHCTAKKPKCTTCPLWDVCDWEGKQV